MSSHYLNHSHRPRLFGLAVVGVLLCAAATAAPDSNAGDFGPLRVCSDPNNLPFSNEAEEGFENALAEFVSRALGRQGVEYAWQPQRRGFIRNTLNAKRCDVVMSAPAEYELAYTTIPYYRSTYVFVYRPDAGFDIAGIDDARLRRLKIGVHAIGDDYSSTPGAAAIARRGLVENLVGFSIYGDYSEPHPPSRLIEAVADHRVDVAIAWGPMAGYFASRSTPPLRVVPVTPEHADDGVAFAFDISMATRRDDVALHEALDRVIRRHGDEMRGLLERYGVPLLDPAEGHELQAEAFP